VLSELPAMPSCYILTVKPGYAVSTRDVYRGIDKILFDTSGSEKLLDKERIHADVDGVIKGLESGSLNMISRSLSNVLELYTIDAHPDIAVIKKTMLANGAIGALMSGSGPTVFGLFTDEQAAIRCGDVIRSRKLAADVDVSTPVNM